jgi:hypothetical protein
VPGQIDLQIRRPTIDLETMLRSYRGRGATKDELVAAINWYSSQLGGTAPADPANAVAFDDPEVSALLISVDVMNPADGTISGTFAADPITLPAADPTKDRGFVTVTVKTPVAGQVPAQPQFVPGAAQANGQPSLIVTLPADSAFTSVYVLHVDVQVSSPKGASGDLPWSSWYDVSWTALGAKPPVDKTPLTIPGPTVVFEAIGSTLPTGQEMNSALSVSADPVARTVSATVTLSANARRNVGTLVVSSKTWRWRGLPVPDPTDKWPRSFTSQDAWASALFAQLSGDAVARTVRVSSGSPSSIDYSGSTQSIAVQFRAQCHSRYAPLIPLEQTRFVRGTQWSGATLPPNQPKLTAPSIQALLPLTQRLPPPDGTPQGVPPVLLLLDEPCLVQGGFTEGVEAEILADNPANPAAWELGRDPIVSTQPAPALTKTTASLVVEGPLGYSSDTAAVQDRLFRTSSYLLYAPASAHPWDFARVRLRRRADRLDPNSAASDWTEPQWVQFPPAADFSGAQFTASATGNRSQRTLQITVSTNEGMQATAAEPRPAFIYAALVTSRITVQGELHTMGESYVGILFAQPVAPGGTIPVAAGGTNAVDPGVPINFTLTDACLQASSHLCVRLIEIQQSAVQDAGTPAHVSWPSDADFWDALLPTEGSADVGYRITRISQPFELAL